ncbi:hypothetical protein P8H27_14000 [Pseudomonas sp. sp1636]|uniref:hypothetical protein n=1 Tax=Pseudomonas sp. sp1636 TaxID=3036707 RepID=UPI0025A53B76|nr:hypothetical protein [Pseudomonas sp. sp1636]MDM8349999.1 hypothetical protein [Pseudomonas sp. sp1636]
MQLFNMHFPAAALFGAAAVPAGQLLRAPAGITCRFDMANPVVVLALDNGLSPQGGDSYV